MAKELEEILTHMEFLALDAQDEIIHLSIGLNYALHFTTHDADLILPDVACKLHPLPAEKADENRVEDREHDSDEIQDGGIPNLCEVKKDRGQ